MYYQVMHIIGRKALIYKKTKLISKAQAYTRQLQEQGVRAYYIKRGQ